MDEFLDRGPTCIGVAIDPGKPCELALRYAAFLAAWHGAELVLITSSPVQGREAVALEGAARRLGELAAGLEPEPGGRDGTRAFRLRPAGCEVRRVRADSTRALGTASVPVALRAAAEAEGVDLLVMPRGVCWAGALYPLESVAERVVRASEVPVLIVPETGARGSVGPRPTVVVPAIATDRVRGCLDRAFSFSDRLEGRVAVVPAGGDGYAALRRLRRALVRLGTDLVVTAAEARRVGGTRTLSHVVAGLVRTAPCPVLVLPLPWAAAAHADGPAPRTARQGGSESDRTGSSPTSVRWHLRTSSVQRRPTDERRVTR